MKKIFSAIISSSLKGRLCGLLFALLATTTLWAYDFQSGDLYYNITSDTTVEVTYQYKWSSDNYAGLTTATIPETVTYNGTTYSVTSIGGAAFENCSSFTSVTIPNSVTSIGSDAFYHCSSLTSVTIPNSVTNIGSHAFEYCSSLTSIAIPNSVTSIGGAAFENCSSLTSVTIPNSVTSIGGSAFKGTGIYNEESNWENDVLYIDNCLIEAKTSISGAYAIKEGTRLIADDAFSNCSSLTSVTIPNSVTSIGDKAFYGCSSLTSITIPEGVTSIGGAAFSNCSSLTSITIPENVTSIGDWAFSGCIFTKDNFVNNSSLDAEDNNYWGASIGDTEIDGLLIRNVTVIDCRPNVTSVIIPESVTSIGSSAFYNCSSLTSVTIPNSVTNIGDWAFSGCSSLTSITIPESVTSIGGSAFSGCSSLTSINIPNSVTSIGDYAFSDCSSLTSVTIGNSVTSIGDNAFYNCSSLTSVTIPNSVTSLGAYAFSGTGIYKDESNWENDMLYIDNCLIGAKLSISGAYTIKENTRLIADYAFYGLSVESIFCYNDTPPSVTSNTFSTGYGGPILYNATLYVPSSTPYKNHSVWGEFEEIVSMGDNVIFIDNGVYYQIIHTESIFSLDLWQQEDFDKLTPISLIGSQYWHCNSKYGAYMSGYQNNVNNPNEDWLISPAMDLSKHSSATLEFSHAFGPAGSIPTTARQKAQYTCWVSNDFYGDVATATWTELPITYGTSAWDFITTTVNIPTENLKENCHIAWKYVCTNSSATWEIQGANVTASPKQNQVRVISAPNKYSGEIVIPATVIRNDTVYDVVAIGNGAFCDCSSLTSLAIPNSVTSIGNDAFWGCSSLTSITIPNSVTSIGSGAFGNCSSLTSITIPNSVTSIGYETFRGCSSLTSVTLPNSVTNIGQWAFENCTSLNEITLPASVKSIDEEAFAGCTKLYDIYCFAMEPPTAYESSFANYNAFLHVPCDNQRVYLLDVIFGNFKYIECIEAETTPTDTVVVTPSFNDAEFIWPSNSSADSYTLAISKDGEIFCTLTFNANGQLTGIAFAPSRNGQHNAPAAAQTANGFAFTVTGLDEGANYTYELLIQDRSGNTLQSYSGEFRTQSTNDRTVTVEYDAAQGQVTGAGTYLVGDTVTLTATPNDGYRFVRWSNEVEDNPYTFVISDNVTLSAEFEAVIHSAVENTTPSQQSDTHKLLRDGQLLILRDGKTYNVMGAEVK